MSSPSDEASQFSHCRAPGGGGQYKLPKWWGRTGLIGAVGGAVRVGLHDGTGGRVIVWVVAWRRDGHDGDEIAPDGGVEGFPVLRGRPARREGKAVALQRTDGGDERGKREKDDMDWGMHVVARCIHSFGCQAMADDCVFILARQMEVRSGWRG